MRVVPAVPGGLRHEGVEIDGSSRHCRVCTRNSRRERRRAMAIGYVTREQPQGDGEGRWDEVEILETFWTAMRKGGGVNLTRLAKEMEVPESTLRHWIDRARSADAPAAVVEFFESPAGLWILHQIVVAAVFVLTQVVGGGIRSVCCFLALSGLWRFVGSGYGTICAMVAKTEEAIGRYGETEKERLSAEMAPKEITLAPDETFHRGRPCLVAMEPVSNFILVEEYAPDRKAETWKEAAERGLDGLPVQVLQCTGDEGASLLKFAEGLLGVAYSPDLFHPMRDLGRATSLPLERREAAAAKTAEKAERRVDALVDEAEAYDAARSGPGRPRDYTGRIEEALAECETAAEAVAEASARREEAGRARRGLSEAYHPYDLAEGSSRSAARVEADLEEQLEVVDRVAGEAGLGQRCLALIGKARKVVKKMVPTIAFVHGLTKKKVEALGLPASAERVVFEALVPAFYLEEFSRKAPTAEKRAAVRETAAGLHALADERDGPLGALPPEVRGRVEATALECARLFQRSSSCVEGRNGVLSLRHHGLHRLGPRKLRALTVVHNFFIERADGTTAAERFFGRRPRDLFTYLLQALPPPARPAARRSAPH